METSEVFSRYQHIISRYLGELSGVIMVVTDESLQIVDCNKAFLKYLHLGSRPVGVSLKEYLLPESLQELPPQPQAEYRESPLNFVAPDSTIYYFSCHIFAIQDGYLIFGEKPLLTGEDIIIKMSTLNNELTNMTRELNKKNTALEKANAEITRLSRIDAMTGIYNRGYFMEVFNRSYSYSRRQRVPLAAFIADLDLFKSINDTYGHQAGDEVLISFAKLLQAKSREEDFPARFGGEEFAMLLPHTDLEEAAVLAERFRAELENTILPGIAKPVTASFGVTMLRDDDTQDSFLQRADSALYEAKNRGRNKVVLKE